MGARAAATGAPPARSKPPRDDARGAETTSKGKKPKAKAPRGASDADAKAEEGIAADGHVDFGFERVEALKELARALEASERSGRAA